MATVELEREATEILRRAYGPKAKLRDGQWDAVSAILEPGARLLLVQATGWGKSVVYFLALSLLRRQGRGVMLVVSPLISLMRNQVAFAAKFGLHAAAIHSENQNEWAQIESRLAAGGVDVLFVSPERLHVSDFRKRVLEPYLAQTALVVVDEAHCISEWGHDFRPEYRSILKQLIGLPKEASILAATATATRRVEDDLRKVFGPFLEVQRGRLVRPSLRLVGLNLTSPSEKLAWLAHYIPRMPGSGIVYGLTVFDVKEVARWLQRNGIDARPYFAELGPERRTELEDAFSRNEIKVLAATTALGMGYDKADVGFVIHFQMPASLIGYYQQIGRAGRAMDRAFAVLLGGGADDEEIIESFVNSARPPNILFERVIEALQTRRQSFAELNHDLMIAPSQLRHILELLDAADALIGNDGMYGVRLAEAKAELAHGDLIRNLRREEFAQMRNYLESNQCRMQSVALALGDEKPAPCGICDRCRPLPTPHLDSSLIAKAAAFLQGETKRLVPRVRLPLDIPARKPTLGPDERCEMGIVLGVYGDGHWGQWVREGKYRSRVYPPELVEAARSAVEAMRRKFDGIAWIPTSHGTSPLPVFIEALARKLGVPAREVVNRRRPGPPQKSMSAAREQFLNVWDSFEISDSLHGHWLLVDDIVDSGWTLTVVGLRMRHAGASSVTPLALAAASTSRIRFADEEAIG